ncbi:hypothetical protein [Fodinibius sp.]|uniref:hypothetical protein n=1 Tax=Fodinibius sp. TaxID=1872440 RepID=UPI002ACD5D92|nr:hypothetical protein [Fodinibius sp.]MDZ7659666.1 hypothetical protein [Fodinibius sp.]
MRHLQILIANRDFNVLKDIGFEKKTSGFTYKAKGEIIILDFSLATCRCPFCDRLRILLLKKVKKDR